jgi:protein-tyrosine phosphatase
MLVRDRARAGQLAEIGCIGGHGRTGTALACLALLSGVKREEAVSWVKTNYCSSAVESPEQAAYVSSLDFET